MVVDFAATKPQKERRPYMLRALRHFRDMIQTYYDWIELPVDVQTFVEHTFFLNQENEIYPNVMRDLIEMTSGKYVEAVLTGAIGTAKTTMALLGLAYELYKLSRMAKPHREFKLQQSTEIVFIFQSINAKLAKGVDYMRFQNMIANSKFFQEEFPFNKDLESEMHFPRRVIVKPLSGDPNAAIGQNIIGALIDEVNFFEIIENSTRSGDGGTYDQATLMYNTIQRRRKSRFMTQGRLPGMICLVSSKRYPGEFTDRKMAEAREELKKTGSTSIFVYDKKIWEVKPEGTYTGRTFTLFLGDTSRKPRLVEEGEIVSADEEPLLMQIPIEFRADFERDILSSIRDIAGHAIMALHPFILDVESAVSAFGRVESVLSNNVCDFVASTVTIHKSRFWNPKEPRYAHLDLALTGDSAGVAVGCVRRFIEVDRNGTIEMLPEINIDLLLQVRPPKNGEINFAKIRTLLYKLRELGLNLKWVSADSYQSRDSLQILAGQGFATGLVSMDVDSKPYDVLKTALYDRRVLAPESARCQTEIVRLERDPKTGKIDHPSGNGGSKDVADALAGVVYGLTMQRQVWAQHNVPLSKAPASLTAAIEKTKTLQQELEAARNH
jgi:hypothetical protein